MVQILGLRTRIDPATGREHKYHAFHKKGWQAPGVREIIKDPDFYLSQVPDKERWNLYYTLSQCKPGPTPRLFVSQDVIPFDIDGIDNSSEEVINKYIPVVCEALGIAPQKTGIIFSGNGLHFLIGLETPFTDPSYFIEQREHYKAICEKITLDLGDAGLIGMADPSVFCVARILRMPNTTNRKPGKQDRLARVLQAKIENQVFIPASLSGIPEVATTDQVTTGQLKRYPKPDREAILAECEFLKWCDTNPAEVHEPHWYAMLSVVARLENGSLLATDWSKRFSSPSIDGTDIDVKIAQAMKASGPRTCANIDSVWGKCSTCKHFQKINSPIAIRGPNHIRTEMNGFHDFTIMEDGEHKDGKPNFMDLKKAFEREAPYKTLGTSGICLRWEKTHYAEYGDAYIKNFAQENFDPPPLTKLVDEFTNLVHRTNLIGPQWFEDTTQKLMNFKNCVLNTETMEMLPHAPSYGFKHCLDYDYEPGAVAPEFQKFLGDVTCGDPAIQTVLLEFMGYVISGDPLWEHKQLVLLGEGSNGKSTFLSILKALVGRENYSVLGLNDLKDPTRRQLLDGKLVNIAEEAPSRGLLETEAIKLLSSGGEVTVRKLYKGAYKMINRAKIIFSCNAIPVTEDASGGYFRRFLIVPFRATFSRAEGNVDHHIDARLKKELPGILNLALGAYREMFKRKDFSLCSAIDEELVTYEKEVDHTSEWIRENLSILDSNAQEFVVVSQMFSAYRDYMDRSLIKPLNILTFGKRLAKSPLLKGRLGQKKLEGKTTRVIIGAKTREPGLF